MTSHAPISAYPADTFELGPAPDGGLVSIVPVTHEAAEHLGRETATFGAFAHYGLSVAAMTRAFAPGTDNGARYQACINGVLAGGVVIRDPWLVGPYLQTIAVLPLYQGCGIGGMMLGWFEARARLAHQRNIWLCVSAFNVAAQRFYRAHGWQHAADLPDLIRDGCGEALMRKRLVEPLPTAAA